MLDDAIYGLFAHKFDDFFPQLYTVSYTPGVSKQGAQWDIPGVAHKSGTYWYIRAKLIEMPELAERDKIARWSCVQKYASQEDMQRDMEELYQPLQGVKVWHPFAWRLPILDTSQLDDALRALENKAGAYTQDKYYVARIHRLYAQLEGTLVYWHGDTLLPLVILDDGTLGLRTVLTCEKCGGDPLEVYYISGLHHGAWCYVANKAGVYQANMRDQSYYCNKHAPSKQAAGKDG